VVELSRRALLGCGVTAGGVVVGGLAACRGDGDRDGSATGPAATSGAAPPLDASDWESVRAQFTLDPDVLHFAAFTLAAHPRPVAAAIAEHRAGLDADTHGYMVEHQAELEAAVLEAAAEYLGASRDEVALTDSTTMGLGLLYGGVVVGTGQRVLTTEHDFYATHEALRLRTDRVGGMVDRVRLYDDPAATSVDEIVGRLADAVTPATRVVAVTWVHSGTGVKLPIAEIAAAVADLNAGRDDDDRALLCVDGVHGLGVEDVAVGDLGADFLVAGTHKWMFGPRGTGIVWGRTEPWAAVEPIIPAFAAASFERYLTGTATSTLAPGAANTPGGYHSFEHRWALTEAVRFQLAVGRDRVAERTHTQATRLKAGLADIAGVRLVTPMSEDLSAGIVCLQVAGRDAFAAVEALHRQRISASVTPYREPYLRLGPSIVTTPEQVDAVIDAVAALR
jgi:selenocysteine lyase/cysteine desulfurase